MTNYSIHVLKVGEAEVPAPEVYWMSHWGEWETLYFYVVVIRGNGITAVVNTGPPADLALLNQAWKQFAGERCHLKRLEEEHPERALAALDIRPEEVDYVLLTPLQAYATANLPLFSRAKICFSRRGWIEDIVARLPYLHVPRSLCIPDDVLKYLMFDACDRVCLLEEEAEICPGIAAWWAGTHHRSSVVYSVATDRGTVMIGDCAFKYANLAGAPLGIAESIAEGDKAYRRIQAQAAEFIPLYDPEVLRKYPTGIVR